LGKTIAFIEATLTDETGTVVATATATARVVETAKAVREGAAT
jgi:acyl-coenzyme A thioesterase PaaI-like protein